MECYCSLTFILYIFCMKKPLLTTDFFFGIYEILMDFNNLSDKNTSPMYLAVT